MKAPGRTGQNSKEQATTTPGTASALALEIPLDIVYSPLCASRIGFDDALAPRGGARRVREERVSELSDKARELTRSGRGVFRPTDGDRARVSAALRSRLGAAALPRVVTTAAIVWPTKWRWPPRRPST